MNLDLNIKRVAVGPRASTKAQYIYTHHPLDTYICSSSRRLSPCGKDGAETERQRDRDRLRRLRGTSAPSLWASLRRPPLRDTHVRVQGEPPARPPRAEPTRCCCFAAALLLLPQTRRTDVPIAPVDDAHVERAWKFFREPLKSTTNVVGPMVDQSEPFRCSRARVNAHLCYTPMYHARL